MDRVREESDTASSDQDRLKDKQASKEDSKEKYKDNKAYWILPTWQNSKFSLGFVVF